MRTVAAILVGSLIVATAILYSSHHARVEIQNDPAPAADCSYGCGYGG